jgi:hypothetical protein
MNISKAMEKSFRKGKEYERLRIQIMIIKKQTAYIKAGLIGGSCGLSWLISELEGDFK